MKVVVVKNTKTIRRFLVEVRKDSLLKEVSTLVGKGKYSKAASVVLAKGNVERELTKDEVNKVGASLLLEEGGSK